MPINTTQIRSLLRPGLNTVFGDYADYPAEWTEIFTKSSSDMQVEYDVEVKLLGLAQVRTEGASSFYDSMGQRSTTAYVHKEIAIGYIITKQAIQDNLYKNAFPKQNVALKSSMLQTKETLGASVLNNGFSSSFLLGDGKPLFSTTHPIDNGTVANTFSTQADLNETSLEDAIIAIANFKDAAGLRKKFNVTKMIIPVQLKFVADRILGSQFRTNTANNDISAVYNMNSVPGGASVNHYLTDTNQWQLLTDANDSFKYFERQALEKNMFTEEDTQSLKVSVNERYSFGCSNFRGAFGSSGAS